MYRGEDLMKKSLVFFIMILILASTGGCLEQKFPQGKQVPPPGAEAEAEKK
jgi:hypothetical protein